MHRCSKKCPKCRVPCVSKTQLGLNDSSICMINAPLELMECYNDDDLREEIWAGMQPPRISDPTPAVNPERLERVRELLDATAEEAAGDDDDAIATRVESTISIEIGEDGTIKKTKSRREIKWYAACPGGDDDAPYCMPDCTPASERDIKELFRRSNCANVPQLNSRRDTC